MSYPHAPTKLKILWLLTLSILLSGCIISNTEYASNNSSQYLESKNGPDLVVPPPLTSTNMSHFYHLPDPQQVHKISIVPPVDHSDAAHP